MVKDLPANAGDGGSIPGLGRSNMPRTNSAHGPNKPMSHNYGPGALSPGTTREATVVRSLCTDTR